MCKLAIMDRTIIEEHLAKAENHIALGEWHIARQKEIVAELERDGHDPTEAVKLLSLFESTIALHVADRDRLRTQLVSMKW